MLDLQTLSFFKEIALSESLHKASEKLFISPQALSKKIIDLENSLGAELFRRSKKGVVLTEFGQYFLNQISPLLEASYLIESNIHNYLSNDSHKIHISIDTTNTFSFIIYKLLTTYMSENPEIAVTISFDPIVSTSEILDANDADVIFACNRPGLVDYTRFDTFPLYVSPTVAIASKFDVNSCPSHTLHWSDIKNLPIFLRSGEIYYSDIIIKKCIEHDFYPNVSFSGNNMFDPSNFVRNMEGIAFVPDFIGDALIELFPDIYRLDFNTGIYTEYVFIVKKHNSKKTVITALLSYLTNSFNKHPASEYVII